VSNVPAAVLLRKVGLLALLGVAVVFLSGPVLGVLATLLAFGLVVLGFAFVGLLVWGLFLLLFRGPRVAGRHLRDLGKLWAASFASLGVLSVRGLTLPARVLGATGRGVGRLAAALGRGTWAIVRVVAEMVVVTAAGAGVGAAVGVYLRAQGDPLTAIPMHAAVGALIAFLGWGVMTAWEHRPARRRPAVG
jgi:hypothetical protein